MLATFLVTSTDDAGPATLRQAILDANGSLGADQIEFSIGAGGPQVIQSLSELPQVTESVTINGTTQPGFAGTPLIELRGDLAGDSNGLVLSGANSTVRSLSINRFSSTGGEAQALLIGSGGHALEGNFLGVDLSGKRPDHSDPLP